MNLVALIGRLTAEPDIREFEGKKGKEDLIIASWTLAVDRVGSEEADFIRCKAFGKTAEFAGDYLAKGQRIGVSGRLQTGSYVDKEDVTRYTTEVIVDRITFADSKKDDSRKDEPEEKERGRSRKKGGK